MSETKIFESYLYAPIRDFLKVQGYTVRGEVLDCDICAVKDGKLTVIELKRHLSVDLLAQAVKRQGCADAVYVAIPKPKNMRSNSKRGDMLRLLKKLELGLIMVSFRADSSFVEVILDIGAYKGRGKSAKAKKALILDEIDGRLGDFNVGGTTGQKLLTAYREKAIFIACCLLKSGPLAPKTLREMGTDPKKTTAILYENHYGWFERIERGLYALTKQGHDDLKLYPELAEYYCGKATSCKNIGGSI